jgi:hypothetical protein
MFLGVVIGDGVGLGVELIDLWLDRRAAGGVTRSSS